MRRRKTDATTELDRLDCYERDALENGWFAELVFDNERHHRETWERVRAELLAWYARHRPDELPESWFRFDGEPANGAGLVRLEKRTTETGNRYLATVRESTRDYLRRTGAGNIGQRLPGPSRGVADGAGFNAADVGEK